MFYYFSFFYSNLSKSSNSNNNNVNINNNHNNNNNRNNNDNNNNDEKNWKRSWMEDKKGINNKVWKWNTKAIQQRWLWLVEMQQWAQENIVKIRITGGNDRNKSVEEDQGISERWQMQVMWEHRETVHHLSGCKKLVGTEYAKRHNNTLKALALNWTVENGLLHEDTKWYKTNWERGKVIEKDGKKLCWDWEHPMKTGCIAHRLDLTLEDTSKKTILLIDMARPNEYNKVTY